MMRVQVKMFAVARDIAGADRAEVELPAGATIADLRGELLARFPEFEKLGGKLMFSLNMEYAVDGAVVSELDEIACIPPVSGG